MSFPVTREEFTELRTQVSELQDLVMMATMLVESNTSRIQLSADQLTFHGQQLIEMNERFAKLLKFLGGLRDVVREDSDQRQSDDNESNQA